VDKWILQGAYYEIYLWLFQMGQCWDKTDPLMEGFKTVKVHFSSLIGVCSINLDNINQLSPKSNNFFLVKAVITFPYTLALSQSKFLTILKTYLRWLSSFDSLIPLIVSNLIWSSSWRIFGSFTLALRVNLVETFWQSIPPLLELLFFCNALKRPQVVSHHYLKITNKRSNCVVLIWWA